MKEAIVIPEGTTVAYGCGDAPSAMGGGEYFFPVEYRLDKNGRMKKVATIETPEKQNRFRYASHCAAFLIENGYSPVFEFGLHGRPVEFAPSPD